MTVADKLLQINQVKQEIKQAIENKGVAMSGVPFTEYADKVAEISSTYEDYARTLYLDWGKSNQFEDAWEHSLTVNPSEIERNSTTSTQYGTLQYPNGEDNGVIIPDSVTSIGEYAFSNWTSNNQPLVIPNSVTSIERSAFSNWGANNQPLVIPNSVISIGNQAFYNWTSNNQPLVIPNSVTSIGTNAFERWTSNNQPLVIPNSVTSIGNYAFNNWPNVPYVEMKSETPPILAGSNVFSNTNNAPIYVPDSAVDAYKNATNWSALSSRIFPISEISGGGGEVDEYFYYTKSYYTITNKSTLFSNAWEHSLTVDPSEINQAQYPNGETEGVIIPQGVTSIGNDAFINWTSNNQPLVIPNSVTSIGNSAFDNWPANNHPLVIPDSVTSIGTYAFYNWRANNQPLVIPNSLTSIGQYAFRDWRANNQPLVIPNSVTSIGNSAFRNWTANNHPLVIPDSVTSIGGSAFDGWSNVPYIEMKSETPPTLGSSNAFDNQNNAPIYVPHSAVNDYKTATNWSALSSRIFSINEK